MRAFIYQAALLCEDCGEARRAALKAGGRSPENPNDESSYDSNDYPKGPFDAGESDSPDHCDHCGAFLENPLTPDGVTYVKAAVEKIGDERFHQATRILWRDSYSHCL